MRSASVSGIADSSQYLPTSHALPGLHPHATWLQVRVVRELSATQIQSDAITQRGVDGYRHGGVKLPLIPWNVIRKTISGHYDSRVGDSQYWLAIGVVRAVVDGIAREERSIHALLPVDRISSRDPCLPIDDKDSAPVVVVLLRMDVSENCMSPEHRRAGVQSAPSPP